MAGWASGSILSCFTLVKTVASSSDENFQLIFLQLSRGLRKQTESEDVPELDDENAGDSVIELREIVATDSTCLRSMN